MSDLQTLLVVFLVAYVLPALIFIPLVRHEFSKPGEHEETDWMMK